MKPSQPQTQTSPINRLTGNRIFWLRLFVLLCSFGCAATAHAQQSFRLNVTHDISYSKNGFDFRQIEVSTANGAPAAKDLTVWCHVYTDDGWGRPIRPLQPIATTLKAGEVSIKKDLYLPLWNWRSEIRFTLDASANTNPNKSLLNYPQTPGANFDDVLVVESAKSTAPSSDKVDVVFNRKRTLKQAPWRGSNDSMDVYSLKNGATVSVSTRHRRIDSLPKRWIGYTSLEQVVVDSDELLEFAQDSERFEALVQWVAMGGSVVICDCDEDFGNVPKFMRALSNGGSAKISKMDFYRPTEKLETQVANFIKSYPRGGPTPNQGQYIPNSDFLSPGNQFSVNWQEVSVEPDDTGGLKLDTESEVLLHRYVKGRFLLYRRPYENFSKAQRLGVHFLDRVSSRRRVINAMGTDNATGQPYKKWQLIGVGVAPKGLFMFVVVAFMTLIGPFGFSYLKTKKRLHYQIWLVPLVSALACLTLLSYAFLSEGVGTKLRPTVFVELDQNRQMAATYGRYSVYSALQPRPYRFGDDQFATLEHAADGTPSYYRWFDDGTYQISGGQASARTVHQIFRAMPVKTDSRIIVSQSEDTDSVKLTNGLKDEVKMLVVNVGGKFYFSQNLAASDSQLVSPTLLNKFSKTPSLTKFFTKLIPTNNEDYRSGRRRRMYNKPVAANFVPATDVGISQIVSLSTTTGILQNLADGHYIAFLDAMSEVPSVVPGAREIDPKVIVHGKW